MNLADLLATQPASVLPPPVLAPAPVPPEPAPATPDGSDMWRAEQITARELAGLAGKLLKSPSDDRQSIGRALFRAIKGEPFAQQGHRNQTAYKIAAECVEAYPNLDPETVLACVSASISRVQQEGSKMTEEKFLGMLTRLQDERRARVVMVQGVAGRLGKALQAQAQAVTKPMPEAAAWVTQAAAPRAPEAGQAPPASDETARLNTLLIKADGRYYLRRPEELTYRWVLDSHESLAIELAHQFGTNNGTLVTHDATGSPLPIADLVRVYASNAHRIVHDYSSARTTWDRQTATLHVGLPDALPEPALDADVHEWLAALAGTSTHNPGTVSPNPEGPVRDLYDWIASTDRKSIDRPSAGLVVVGPKDTGKSLLALALALTWGVLPVKLTNAVERFNGSLLSSPFWHADERMPEDLSDARYREMVQERSRLIEPKGREKVELRGCARLIFTLNEPEDLRLGGLEGPSALEAVVDRIAYFDCTGNAERVREALDKLRLKTGPRAHDVDLTRVVGHLRAVQVGLVPREQRFLGARSDRTEARRFVLQQGVARQNSETLAVILDYLADPGPWERAYHAEERTFQTGQRFPIVTQEGELLVWPRELAYKLFGQTSAHSRGLAEIKRALKALRGGRLREVSFSSRRLRAEYWPVDLEKFLLASSVAEDSELWKTIIRTVAGNTRDRLGLGET